MTPDSLHPPPSTLHSLTHPPSLSHSSAPTNTLGCTDRETGGGGVSDDAGAERPRVQTDPQLPKARKGVSHMRRVKAVSVRPNSLQSSACGRARARHQHPSFSHNTSIKHQISVKHQIPVKRTKGGGHGSQHPSARPFSSSYSKIDSVIYVTLGRYPLSMFCSHGAFQESPLSQSTLSLSSFALRPRTLSW